SQGDTGNQLVNQTILTTASPQVIEVDLTPEEVWFYSTAADNSGQRTNQYRLARKTPDPNKSYVVRLRARNTGAASAQSMKIDSVLVENYTHGVVELSRGRGGATAGEALPVHMVAATGSPTVTASSTTGNVANDGVDSGNPVK